MAKFILLDGVSGNYPKQQALALYRKHLTAFCGGRIREPGNPAKNSLKKYLDTFLSIYTSTCNGPETGACCLEKPLPVDCRLMALDGSHRIVSACSANRPLAVYFVENYTSPFRYDYLFFRRRFLEESLLLEMALKYCQVKDCRLLKVTFQKPFYRPFFLASQRLDRLLSPVYLLRTSQDTFLLLTDHDCTPSPKILDALETLPGFSFSYTLFSKPEECCRELSLPLSRLRKREQKLQPVIQLKKWGLKLYFMLLELFKKLIHKPMLRS